MTNNEIFESIYKDIKFFSKKNKIIKILSGDVHPSVIDIENLLKQPIEGLLYDLDLDEAQLVTIYKDKPLEFANMMSIVNVIKFLYQKYKEK